MTFLKSILAATMLASAPAVALADDHDQQDKDMSEMQTHEGEKAGMQKDKSMSSDRDSANMNDDTQYRATGTMDDTDMAASDKRDQQAWGDSDGAEVETVIVYELGDFNPSYLASAWLGESVYNYDGNEVGDVTDLVITSESGVEAAVLSVGGIWDIGDTDVAVPIEDFEVTSHTDNEPRLRVDYSEDELLQAASYDQ